MRDPRPSAAAPLPGARMRWPRAPRLAVGGLALLLLAASGAREAGARGGSPPPRPPLGSDEPTGTQIHTVPTTLSVPLTADQSVVIGLPERFWVQCPRYGPVPTCLEGQGLIAQYMNARGGTVSMLYFGVVPWLPAIAGEATEARVQRTVLEFGTSLAQKYARVDWTLLGGAVTFAPIPMKLDGHKASAWRTPRYSSRPVSYGGPRSQFSGECLLFQPPGVERLVYVALDAKGGGTTLDKVTEQLSVRPTTAVNPTGRRAQLVDIAEAADTSRFPVRQLAFDLPAGFVLTPALLELKGEWVYAEARLDAKGAQDAVLRMQQHAADPSTTLAKDHETERGIWQAAERGPSEEVPLAVKGQTAWVFSHPSPQDGPAARAHTAVLRLDDQTLVITWVSLGDAAQIAKDRAAFVGLVGSIDLVARW